MCPQTIRMEERAEQHLLPNHERARRHATAFVESGKTRANVECTAAVMSKKLSATLKGSHRRQYSRVEPTPVLGAASSKVAQQTSKVSLPLLLLSGMDKKLPPVASAAQQQSKPGEERSFRRVDQHNHTAAPRRIPDQLESKVARRRLADRPSVDPEEVSSSGEVRNSSAAATLARLTACSLLLTAPASHSNLGSTTKNTYLDRDDNRSKNQFDREEEEEQEVW